MPSPTSDSSRDALLERLAEEFVERHRRGERPPLSEYIDRYPDLAAEIRDLFPALVQIENLKPAAGDLTGAFVPTGRLRTSTSPERLGDYRILREIGQGGMGVVYEAEQESLGPARRPQGAAAAGAAQGDLSGALPARGQGGGPAAPHEHRAGLRRRRA